MVTYKYRNNLYTVTPCTISDIPSHIEKVLSYWRPDEIELQKQRMEDAVKYGCAYKLTDSEGNLHTIAYYEKLRDDEEVCGIALWWSHYRLFFMFGLWFKKYTKYKKIYTLPHTEGKIAFKSILTKESIQDYMNNHRQAPFIDMEYPVYDRVKKLTEVLEIEEL